MITRDEFYEALGDRIPRDEFYEALLDNSGTIHFGKVGDRIVMIWDGINPILMSFEFFENFDWEAPEVGVVTHNTIQICQYQLKHVKHHLQYMMIEFTVSPMPKESVPQEYWDGLDEWKQVQELE